MSHPAYSSDLAPSGLYLFKNVQNELAGKHFKDDTGVKNWLSDPFASKPKVFYERGPKSARKNGLMSCYIMMIILSNFNVSKQNKLS